MQPPQGHQKDHQIFHCSHPCSGLDKAPEPSKNWAGHNIQHDQPTPRLLGGNKEGTTADLSCPQVGRNIFSLLKINILEKLSAYSERKKWVLDAITEGVEKNTLSISSDKATKLLKNLLARVSDGASAADIRVHLTALILGAEGENHQKMNVAFSIMLRITRAIQNARIAKEFQDFTHTVRPMSVFTEKLNTLIALLAENVRPSGVFIPGGVERVRCQLHEICMVYGEVQASFDKQDPISERDEQIFPDGPFDNQDPLYAPVARLCSEFAHQILASSVEGQNKLLKNLETSMSQSVRNIELALELKQERDKNRFKTCRVQAGESYLES